MSDFRSSPPRVPYSPTSTAATLLTRIKVAVVERAKHATAYEQFTESLPPPSVAQWKEMVVAWEAAPATARNPYEYKRARTSHMQSGFS